VVALSPSANALPMVKEDAAILTKASRGGVWPS